MKKQIVMPAHLMNDLEHPEKNEGRNLFADFSDVAQRLEVRPLHLYRGLFCRRFRALNMPVIHSSSHLDVWLSVASLTLCPKVAEQ